MGGNETDGLRLVLATEQGKLVYDGLRDHAACVLERARQDVGGVGLRDEERVEVLLALANMEWSMARDAIEAAVGIEREERRLRAEVTAAAYMAQGGD